MQSCARDTANFPDAFSLGCIPTLPSTQLASVTSLSTRKIGVDQTPYEATGRVPRRPDAPQRPRVASEGLDDALPEEAGADGVKQKGDRCIRFPLLGELGNGALRWNLGVLTSR